MCMREPLPRFLQDKRNGTGGDTFSCGSIMPYSRKSRHRFAYSVLLQCSQLAHPRRQDFNRAREIYKAAIHLIPHKQFTFAKLWIMFARFEIRRLDLATARKTLGGAIGMCPKETLFKGYIQLELEVSLSTAMPTGMFISSQ